MSDQFEAWGIVEIMGHQRIAGRISEQAIGGTAFVRVDVPASEDRQAFTKMFGSGAIYAISITSEETARVAANRFRETPMDAWDARQMMEQFPSPQNALEFGDPDLD